MTDHTASWKRSHICSDLPAAAGSPVYTAVGKRKRWLQTDRWPTRDCAGAIPFSRLRKRDLEDKVVVVIAHSLHFSNKYFFQRQGDRLGKQGMILFQYRQCFLCSSPYQQADHTAPLLLLQDVQTAFLPVDRIFICRLNLAETKFQFVQIFLEQQPSFVDQTHLIAQVLQLPQIVAGDDNGQSPGGNLSRPPAF